MITNELWGTTVRISNASPIRWRSSSTCTYLSWASTGFNWFWKSIYSF